MTFSSIHHPDHMYFVTASICGWKHLFGDSPYTRIVLDSLSWLREKKRMQLFAFVILPSHLHAILKPQNTTIGELVQDFGSFTAHDILKELKRNKSTDLLEFFNSQRRDMRHQHSIWQDIQAKNVFSKDFLIQKIEYIHQNPISKDWRLVSDRADYKYSSACFYDRGGTPIIEIDDIREYL
jgi:putative transposase